MQKESQVSEKAASSGQQTVFAILAAISVAHLLNDMIQSVIPAIYPVIKESYGFTFGEIGLITLVFQSASSLLQPLTGWYADRKPRPYSLAGGMCLTLSGLCLLASASSYATILMAVALIGCGSSVFHPGASRVAQLASGGRKSLAQSIFQVGGNGGSALGPLVAALIVIPFGQGAVGWFALAALAAVALLTAVGRWYSAAIAAGMHSRVMAASGADTVSRRKVRMAMILLVVLLFSKYFYIASMTDYFTFYLIGKFDVSVRFAQFCLFGFLSALAAGTVAGGFLGDRFGRKYVILGSIFGAAPFALAVPYAGLWGAVILSMIAGLIIASAFSAIIVYATDLMPTRVGMVSGIFFGLMFGLGGIGSALFGWMADHTGIEYVFRISTLLPLLGAVACFLPDTRIPVRN